MHTFKSLLIVIAFFLINTSANAKEAITWATPDFPPWFIASGEKKGQGITDKHVEYYIEQLDEYDHQKATMNFARFLSSAKNGEQLCLANLLKNPEREEYLHYSITYGLGLPQRIIMLADKAAALGLSNKKTLSFRTLFENQSLRANFEISRSYFEEPLVQEAVETNPNHTISAVTAERAFLMMTLDRSDYIIEYPYTANRLAMQHNAAIKSFAIEEIGPFITAYVTCTKSELGHSVIQRINDIIREAKKGDAYKQTMMEVQQYLDPDSAQTYEELYDTIFLNMD